MRTPKLMIAMLFVLAPFLSRADLYDERASEATSRLIRADMGKAERWLYNENSQALHRVRNFVARHRGASSATCTVEAMRCQPVDDSFACYPRFKDTQVALDAIDPAMREGWMQSCRLELGDGLACATDRENKHADCYDSASRARRFSM